VPSAHNHAAEKDRKHHHYLKGSLYCGRCGSRMSLIHAKGNGGTYPYFFCIARMRATGCTQPYVPLELVERAVERAYARVRLSQEQADLVREKLDDALAGMREQAQQRPPASATGWQSSPPSAGSSFTHAGAVPLDLLKQEQDRLTGEIARAERHLETVESLGEVQATLDKALDLLANCERGYARAPGHLRRQWNQVLFERLLVYDDRIEEAEVAEPFATLTDPGLARQLDGAATSETAASSGGGSNEALIVGAAGFEPAASCSQSKCATRLRYAPLHTRVRGVGATC